MKYFILLLLLLSKLSFASSENITISYFESKDNTLRIEEVISKPFINLPTHSLSEGFNFNTFWIKINTKKIHSETDTKILYLNNPTLDYIDFYHNLQLVKQAGDYRKNPDQREIAYAFPLEINASNTYYLKLQTHNGLFIKFLLDTPEEHRRHTDYEKMFLTFFFGFILSLIVYNMFLFITLKERVYFYYIAFQISIFILLLSYSGLGYYLFWHGNHVLNEFIYKRFEILALFFALIFAQTFLNIKSHSFWLNRIINLTLLLLVYVVLTPWEYHAWLFQVVLILTVLLGFIMIVFALIKRVKDATLFFVATFFILLGTLVTFLKIFGFLEVNFITTWSVYIGSMIEAILFSIALANQINALKQREQALVHLQKEKLEQEVQRQTHSLKSMLQEKEILLKEINHRVKNNLQLISSFVSFALVYTKEPDVLQTLKQRIQAIALLYNSLYKQDSTTKVNMKIYISHICNEIFKIYTPNVILNLQIKNIEFSFDKAITLGLLVNEIVTNMITHAFNNKREKAKIDLSLYKEQQQYILEIHDNGLGFDVHKNYESLGLKLIKRLSEKQLKGQLLIESNDKGSSFVITF